MKAVITGHTSGLGRIFVNYFENRAISVVGISRTTGFDLSKEEDYQRALIESAGCDFFVNCAHVGTVQSKFIEDLKYDGCKMITCGSMAANYDHSQYCFDKRIVEDSFHDHKRFYPKKCLLLKMGYLENYQDKPFIPITYETILRGVDFWFENPRCSVLEFCNIRKSDQA